ncbi:hypothetical protein AB1N83_012152, partial [Pleurotus pulmonarius]
TSL